MNGKFLAGFLVVDAVVDFRQYGVPVMAIHGHSSTVGRSSRPMAQGDTRSLPLSDSD